MGTLVASLSALSARPAAGRRVTAVVSPPSCHRPADRFVPLTAAVPAAAAKSPVINDRGPDRVVQSITMIVSHQPRPLTCRILNRPRAVSKASRSFPQVVPRSSTEVTQSVPKAKASPA